MDPVKAKGIIRDAIHRALEEELGTKLPSDGRVLEESIEQLAERVSEVVADEFAQGGVSSPGESASMVSPVNKLNTLTGSQWLWFTKSVLRTSYPSILGHELRKAQGGNKPPQLMRELIEFFTKPDGLVLDPFAGAGGTALGAHLAGRKSVNLELNPNSIAIYHNVCQLEGIEPHRFIQGDCREVLMGFPKDSFDFIATDPPYSPELEQTMSGDGANAKYGRQNRRSGYVTYSDDPRDLSKAESFEAYFEEMAKIGEELLRVLRSGKYLAMILRDAYQKGKYIPTSSIIGQRYNEMGWVLKGEKIWYATGARIRPYGYPNAFVPNIVHQNILIFRKE